MPVVTRKSDLIFAPFDPASLVADPARARGRVIIAQGIVTNAADDSQGSLYLLARLPSDCILLPATFFQVEDMGFATLRVGIDGDPDALISVLKSSGDLAYPLVDGDAKHAKPLWEQLGMAADPRAPIEIWQIAVANATGAGSTKFAFHYTFR